MPEELSPRQGVLLLAGYGLRIAVERGHLYVEDGVGTGNDIGNYFTWTGTDATGATVDPLGEDLVRAGLASATDAKWMFNATNGNEAQRSLYGVSAKVTVPEPTTLTLVGLAMLAVFSSRRISFAAA